MTERTTFINIKDILPEQSLYLVRNRRQVLSGPAEKLIQAILTGFYNEAR